MGKLQKSQALYTHKPNTQYQCRDCPAFILDGHCAFHRKQDVIKAEWTCGLWMGPGKPETFGTKPLGFVRPEESGLYQKPVTCARCDEFLKGKDCERVDKDSPGDDPGSIEPDACCAVFEPKKLVHISKLTR